MALLIAAMVAALAFGQATDDRSSKAKPATEQPEFFDKPEFVVSGVTDFTYRGGHGSDSALRATEALTEATASLSSKAATHSMSLSEAAAREKSLRARVAQEPANAELHHQLAEIEERLGKALEAVQQYQRAAELNASETNIFDWGTELLKHRAAEPAIEVFARGYRLFPESIRIQLGLAVAYDLHGDYEHAAKYFFEAADRHPQDPTPYVFLGKVQAKEITGSAGYMERLARFAAIEPGNALANYYYAACLWQRRTAFSESSTVSRVRLLTERAVQLDPNLASAYLLLGTLEAEQQNLPAAIAAFRKVTELSPELDEAHYRLAQSYE